MIRMMWRVGLQEMVRLGSKVGAIMNPREGDGEGDVPPTDKESEDDDRESLVV